jgi:hypothetical protein
LVGLVVEKGMKHRKLKTPALLRAFHPSFFIVATNDA